MKKVLILHGWCGSIYPHWQANLAQDLKEASFDVRFPQLPNMEFPELDEWKVNEWQFKIDTSELDLIDWIEENVNDVYDDYDKHKSFWKDNDAKDITSFDKFQEVVKKHFED